jgi:hypothetical protein
MIVTHKIKKTKISRIITDTVGRNISIFLINRRGHYLALGSNPDEHLSNFNGWFNTIESDGEYTLYKSLDNVYLDKPATESVNNFVNAERRYSESIERFTLVKNGLIYEVSSYHGFVNIDMDFRGIYDRDDVGRVYRIYRIEGMDILMVEYTKYSDAGLKTVSCRKYLAIKGVLGGYESVNKWSRRYYSYDAYRKSNPEYHIYNALKILCKKNLKLFFAFGGNEDEAVAKSVDLCTHVTEIEDTSSEYIDNVLSLKLNINEAAGLDRAFAYAGCIHAIEGLSMHLQVNHRKIDGLWAGLPWFHQYWSRDELISLDSLLLEHRYEFSKDVLMRNLSEILSDGRLSNRYPSANLGNADGIGWLFKRIHDFLLLCEARENFDSYFSLYDLKYIRERLQFSIKMLLKEHSKDGLILNKGLETWMDTFVQADVYDKDYREGARIEIQCLFLGMLRLMNLLNTYLVNKFVKKGGRLVQLTDDEMDYKKIEEETKKIIREKFLQHAGDGSAASVLNDGYCCAMHDVVRPNIFLAYYIYPELLSPTEWVPVFDHALSRLWCDWDIDGTACGGLSTIDKSHYLYKSQYSGIDNASYHRGDSWFWVNNIAAISMYRLDKDRYKQHIERIVNASTQDILFSGYIGYASELTSSGWFKSGGCLCQTWSIATFIELMHEMYVE